jgi:serine protease AprX
MSLVKYGSWRWMVAGALASLLSLATFVALRSAQTLVPGLPSALPQTAPAAKASPQLSQLAASHPGRRVEVIVQLAAGVDLRAGQALARSADGTVTDRLPIINGLGADMRAAAASKLSADPRVRNVSINARVKPQDNGWWGSGNGSSGRPDPRTLGTAYPLSIRADRAWYEGDTGQGVGVAVVDTGIAGNLPDFQVSQRNASSRVVASAVVNPGANSAGDGFGHGTHIAGIISGDGANRSSSDPLDGKYVGVAPDANLIDVKIADDQGNASVLDVIDGLQFVVDHRSDYNIRVVNLSLSSTDPQSYTTDPLDAAAEAAWNSGVVVVAAAGNLGGASNAVDYAPANDPYVVSVGGVDDMGTKTTSDDTLASWSSHGTTQDGYAKPDVLAPGAHIVSTISPGSIYTQLCPSCVTDGSYFRVGGTSMAAAVVSGAVADLLDAHPSMSPNQVKTDLVKRTRAVGVRGSDRLVDSLGHRLPSSTTPTTTVQGGEVALDKAIDFPAGGNVNQGLTPNSLIDPATGQIDYSRASWSRASWSEAVDPLRASWSRASWSRASWSRASWSATPESCTDFERASWSRASWSDADIQMAQQQCASLLAAVDPTRASWSRASWSRASWSSAFDK